MKSTVKFYRFVSGGLFLLLLQGCYYAPVVAPPAPEVQPAPNQQTRSVRYQDAILNFDRLAQQKADRYGIDYYLLLAIGQAESGGDPGARSSADCRGLTQLKLSTARDYEPRVSLSDLHDPGINLDIGARHMAWLRKLVHQNFPNASLEQRVVLIAAAWNAGWSRVSETGGIPRIRETQKFSRKVLHFYRKYRWNQG